MNIKLFTYFTTSYVHEANNLAICNYLCIGPQFDIHVYEMIYKV